MTKVMVLMPREMHAELKKVAARNDLSMSQAVRRAVRQWIEAGRDGGESE